MNPTKYCNADRKKKKDVLCSQLATGFFPFFSSIYGTL